MRSFLASSLCILGLLSGCDQNNTALRTFPLKWTKDGSSIEVTLPYADEGELNTKIQTPLSERAHSFFGKGFYVPTTPQDEKTFGAQAEALYTQAQEEATANMKQLASQNITPPSGPLFTYGIQTTLSPETQPYQVVNVTFSQNTLGAAHPSSDTFFLNVDIKNQKIVDKLSDIFSAEQQTQIANFVFSTLSAQLKEGLLIKAATDLLPLMDGQFFLTKTGFTVTFPPYVVAPSVFGSPSISVPSSTYESQ